MAQDRPSFEPGRRLRVSASVTLGTLAALAIVLMVNYLAATRLRWRANLGDSARVELSPLTIATLKGLTNDIQVITLYSGVSDLYPQVRNMLREYARIAPRLHLEHIDYEQSPAAAELQKTRYHLASGSSDVVIFDAGHDRYRVVNDNEMSIYDADVGAMLAGHNKEIRRTGFRGETLFTSAVSALAESSQAHAYFVSGHGARRPDNQDDQNGYKAFADLLVERNVSWEVLTNLAASIPKDCQLLVIPGMTESLQPSEIASISQYLQGGGRALILLSTSTVRDGDPLESLLLDWGVELPPLMAEDGDNHFDPLGLYASQFASHPITSPLIRSESKVILPWPRVVAAIPEKALPADAPKATALVTTGSQGNTKSRDPDGAFTYKPGRDHKGEVPMAVAVEHGAVTGVNASPTTTRLVVIGDSLVFANALMKNSAGNSSLASLSIGWLLDRSQTLAIGPRPIAEYRLNLTKKKMQLLVIFISGVLPGAAMLTGVAVWLRRRA